jgi:hypothetical protein
VDQDDKNKLWTNPQSQQEQGNLDQVPTGNVTPPPVQQENPTQTVVPQFDWEESFNKKFIPQNTDALETPIKVPDYASHSISGDYKNEEPQKEEKVAGRLLPHDFLATPKKILQPQYHFGGELLQQKEEVILTEGKSKKGIFLVFIFILLLASGGGFGFYFWQQNNNQKVPQTKILLSQREESINRVISGLGGESPSLVKIEEDFQTVEYQDPAKVFTIQKPKDWVEEQKDQKIVFSKKTPDKDSLGFQYIPRIEIVGQKTTDFNADLEKVKTDLTSNLKNKIISEVDRSEKDFLAYNIEAITYDNDKAIHVSKLAVSFKGNFYLISASSLNDNWDKYRNMFNEVLTSFSPAKEI